MHSLLAKVIVVHLLHLGTDMLDHRTSFKAGILPAYELTNPDENQLRGSTDIRVELIYLANLNLY